MILAHSSNLHLKKLFSNGQVYLKKQKKILQFRKDLISWMKTKTEILNQKI